MQAALKQSVLVIHDDETFRKFITSILSREGLEVREAESHTVALSILNLTLFDLLISPKRIISASAAFWKFHTAKPRYQCTKTLVLSEPEELEQESFFSSANENIRTLLLPFVENHFRSVINELLDRRPVERKLPAVQRTTDYIGINIKEFLTGSEASTDIYLKLSDSVFKKVAHGGMRIPVDQISRYQNRGVNKLYVHKDQFSNYVGFSLRIANIAKNHGDLPPARKVAIANMLASNLIDQTCFEGISKDRLQDAFMTVDTLITNLSHDSEFFELFALIGKDKGMSAHALSVSAVASLIAKEIGWDRQATLARIVLGGLFHDIGERELPQEILQKRRIDLEPRELRILETHTIRGRDLLLSIKQMPEDVALIASQHHEKNNGMGYPSGLKKEQIHPLARLVATADVFCDSVCGTISGRALSPHDAVAHMNRVHFLELDSMFIEALSRLIRRSTNNVNVNR